MNWGYKILFVYIVFVAGMLWMVFKSSNQKIDLVTKDYYAKELAYQQRIDETKRTRMLSVPVRITEKNRGIEIVFPAEFTNKKIKGTVKLYFPADENLDTMQGFETTVTLVLLPFSKANTHLHYVQVSWEADGLAYYFEQKIIL
jgi:hypothetical protein